jgi:NAD(P)-dependent dehydrogenase (short-subunit alcohol dehydrogenase family)
MSSNPGWGEKTSGLEVARVFAEQIRGKNGENSSINSPSQVRVAKTRPTVLITGVAPHGIGESTAIAIASQSPSTLILASRTKEKLETVAAQIKKSYPDVDPKIVLLDLASQDSVRKAAAEVEALIPKLDLLINNAGLVTGSRQWTKEKIEIQFGTNHIGHFLFTKLLLPLLDAASKGSPAGATRVVNLSSQGHRLSPFRFHDYNIEGKEIPPEEAPFSPMPPAFAKTLPDGYLPIVAYSQSKTANILFSVYLQEHIKSHGITSYAVHPGGKFSHSGCHLTYTAYRD